MPSKQVQTGTHPRTGAPIYETKRWKANKPKKRRKRGGRSRLAISKRTMAVDVEEAVSKKY